MKQPFKPSVKFTDHDVTDESVYLERRSLLKTLGFIGAASLLSGHSYGAGLWGSKQPDDLPISDPLSFHPADKASVTDPLTPYNKVTTYNNFYEFGTGKDDPAEQAVRLKTKPWTVSVTGLVERPLTMSIDDILQQFVLEERIYRMRCVEAWSMVIPWIGFELSALLKQARPLSSAKFVAFETLFDPEQMPGQRNRWVGGGIDYPYVEGLRLDEAMHPLTILSVGLYGKTLLPQNGAPIRLVVPWKYGFKSIKSIVKLTLTDRQPPATWNLLAPHEYGFYANVNPAVDHPRWSQKSERRIGQGGLFASNRVPTEPFNGYSEVASLYEHMDLTKYF